MGVVYDMWSYGVYLACIDVRGVRMYVHDEGGGRIMIMFMRCVSPIIAHELLCTIHQSGR